MRLFLGVVALALVLVRAASVAAQPATAPSAFTPAQRAEIVAILRDALKADPSILRDAVRALQADEGRRQDAASRSAIAAVRQELLHDPRDAIGGNPDGDITLVEFFDVRCPYCRHMQPIVEQLLQRNPRVRLVLKDLPVLGGPSKLGARALLAAARQGSYLRLQSVLLRSPSPTEESLKRDAEALGLDWPRLQRDMADPAIQQKLEANLALARRLGIEGTPAFVAGDKVVSGEVELAELEEAVSSAEHM